jgi:hypothetical protein
LNKCLWGCPSASGLAADVVDGIVEYPVTVSLPQ